MGSIIAHTGAHGTGKTTAVFRHAHELKIRHPELKVGTICDTARRAPGPINKQTTPETQLWIFAKQIERELTALSEYDIVVSDRSIVDAIAYTSVAGFDSLANKMFGIANLHKNKYQDILFHSIGKCNFLADDGFREVADKDFQERIEHILRRLYYCLEIETDEFEPSDFFSPEPPIAEFKPNVQKRSIRYNFCCKRPRVLPGGQKHRGRNSPVGAAG